MTKDILYLAFVSNSHIGVSKKVAAQVKIWKSFGYNVTLITDIATSSLIKLYLNRYLTLFRYFILNQNAGSSIYLRQTIELPLYSFMLKKRSFSYEINADIKAESKNYIFIRRVYLMLFPQKLHNLSAKAFYVSSELAKRLHQSKMNCYVFPNSLQALPVQRNYPRANNVVFVGTPESLWQGFDIFLTIVEGMPSYNFHVIGASSGPSKPNLQYHGTLTGDEYYRTMLDMDYAIGTLAFYRSGIAEGSALKVRDYVSFNLPTVIGYIDSDFSGSDFILQVDSENLSGKISIIEAFFDAWNNRSISIPRDSECIIFNREERRASLIVG